MATTKVLRIRKRRSAVEPTATVDRGTTVNPESGVVSSDDNGSVETAESGIDTINPADIAGSESSGSSDNAGTKPRRKYTRRAGTATKEASQNLGAILFSIHLMGASFVRIPELALPQEEADKLASAIDRVNSFYDIGLFSEKTAAWIHLVATAGSIYGPRFYAAAVRMKAQKHAEQLAVRPDFGVND